MSNIVDHDLIIKFDPKSIMYPDVPNYNTLKEISKYRCKHVMKCIEIMGYKELLYKHTIISGYIGEHHTMSYFENGLSDISSKFNSNVLTEFPSIKVDVDCDNEFKEESDFDIEDFEYYFSSLLLKGELIDIFEFIEPNIDSCNSDSLYAAYYYINKYKANFNRLVLLSLLPETYFTDEVLKSPFMITYNLNLQNDICKFRLEECFVKYSNHATYHMEYYELYLVSRKSADIYGIRKYYQKYNDNLLPSFYDPSDKKYVIDDYIDFDISIYN